MKTPLIYFAQRGDGLIKIGTTAFLDERVKRLAASHGPISVLKTIHGSRSEEFKVHGRLAAHREFGEWFRPHPEVLAFIEDVPKGEVVRIEARRARLDWSERDRAEVAKAADEVLRAILLRMQRRGIRQEAAISEIEEEYGFPRYYLRTILHRRSSSITAHGRNAIHDALCAELSALIEGLKADLEAEAAALAARISQAKGASR